MSDLEHRVDQAFASAVEQQLHEQREIRRLVSRVDEALMALSDGMVDLTDQISGTGHQLEQTVVGPDDLAKAKAELSGAIGEVARQLAVVEDRMTDTGAVDDLRSIMASTRIDLLEAMARLERGSAPVAEAVDETRREVLLALERLGDSVDSTRDAGWLEAIGRLDAVVGAFEQRQTDRDAAGEEALRSLQADAEAALTEVRDAAEQRLVGSVERALADALSTLGADTTDRTVARLDSGIAGMEESIGQALRSGTDRAADDVAARTASIAEQVAADAAQGAVAAVAASAGELSAIATAQIAQAAEHAARDAAERVLAVLTDAGGQLREDLSQTATMLDATSRQVGDRLTESATRTEAGVDRMVEEALRLEGVTDAHVERLAGQAAAAVADVVDETHTRGEELSALLRRLEQVTEAIDPHLQTTLAELTDGVGQLIEGHRSSSRDAMSAAADLLERRAQEALAELATDTAEAVAGLSQRTEETVAGLSQRTAEAVGGLSQRTEETVAGLSQRTAEAVAGLSQRTEETVAGLSQRTEEALAALVRGNDQAAAELRTAVQAVVAEDREEVTQALAALAEASESVRSQVVEAVRSSTDHLSATQQAGADRLAALADDLGRLPDELRSPLTAVIAEIQAGVAAAIGDLQAASSSITEHIDPSINAAMKESRAAFAANLDAVALRSGNTMRTVQSEVVTELRTAASQLAAVAEASEANRTTIETRIAEATSGLEGVVEAQLQHLMDTIAASGQDQQTQATALTQTAAQLIEDLRVALAQGSDRVLEETAAAAAELRSAVTAGTQEVSERSATSVTALQQAAEQLVARLEVSSADATTGLAAKVDQASERVDDASGRILGALERLDDAGASLTRQLTEAGQAVAAQFTGDVESVASRLRSELDTTLETTAERLVSSGESAAEQLSIRVTEAGDRIDRAVASIDEATRTAAASSEAVRGTGDQLNQQLTDTGEAVMAELQSTLAQVTSGLSGVREGTVTEFASLLEAAAERIEVTLGESRAALTDQIGQIRDVTRTEADRQQRAVTQIEQTAEGVVTEVAGVVERLETAVAAQLARLDAAQAEASGHLDSLMTDTAGRLSSELDQTRSALRESVIAAGESGQANLTAVRTEVDRLLIGMGSRSGAVERSIAETAEEGREQIERSTVQLQTLLAEAVGSLADQLATVQQAVETRLGEVDTRRTDDIDRVTAVAERMERSVTALPTEVAGTVAQIREVMLDAAQDTQMRQAGSLTDLTTSIQALRSELTQLVEQLPEQLTGRLERQLRDAAPAKDEDTAQPIDVAQLRADMRADADAVLDAMANRADQLLDGLSVQGSEVMGSLQQAEEALRISLTEAFRDAQQAGLGQLEEATSRLVALGPRLEENASVGVRDIAAEVAHEVEMALLQRVSALREEDTRTAEALRELSDQVAVLISRDDARRHRWAQPRPRTGSGELPPDPPAEPPPAPDDVGGDVVTPRALSFVCPDCGFVAKTPPGLAAHRRTCPAAGD